MNLDDTYRLAAFLNNLPPDVGYSISRTSCVPGSTEASWPNVVIVSNRIGRGEASGPNLYECFLRAYADCLNGTASAIRYDLTQAKK